MRKIEYKDLLKSMTMFFVNEDIDKRFVALKQEKMAQLREQMQNINSVEGLANYIKSAEDSLDNILVLLGVSMEFFKRVISMFRIQRGYSFATEWNTSQIRRFCISDQAFMCQVCNLFIRGGDDKELAKAIPGFKLANFKISDSVMDRLKDDDFLGFLINKNFDTMYNSEISNCNIARVDSILTEICERQNRRLIRNPNVDPTGKGSLDLQVNYCITEQYSETPLFFLKYSFNVTTSRGQSDFKRSVQALRDYIKNQLSEYETKQITIIDGAGWLGRQSDLHEVWDFSDFCLNLQNINELLNII